jgi:NADH-quinone oxidoreductase subunit B
MEIELSKQIEYCRVEKQEADKIEGDNIEKLKASCGEPYPDPTQWMQEEGKGSILLTSLDAALNWARKSSLWPGVCFTACCAFEFMAAEASRFDMSRFGMEIIRTSPRQADLMITAGTLTWKMAPPMKRIYDQMAEPKWVIAMGACAISGGIFASSYNVVPGYRCLFPIDVYIPGCPPRPEALIHGIQMLHKKIEKGSLKRR